MHELNASDSTNLDRLIEGYEKLKQYVLCPAKIANQGTSFEPSFDKAILKTTLHIRNAWEIGENDFESMAIKKNDAPIIPENVSDAPVLKLLKKLNEKTDGDL